MDANGAFGCIKRVVSRKHNVVFLDAVIAGLRVFAPHLGDWKERRVLKAEDPDGNKRVEDVDPKKENCKK